MRLVIASMDTASGIGRKGEELAAAYLRRNGFDVVARNWRFRRLEIDIIAWKSSVLVFVEVKSRSYSTVYSPESSITMSKWANIARAAGKYMEMSDHNWEVRFDVIAVVFHANDTHVVNHYSDVYFPGRY